MAGDTAVRYADYGKGDKVILLLHGYLESIEVWSDFGGMLGKQFRVIAIDLPGHGFSKWGGREVIGIDYMADTVATALEKAEVKECIAVGHSMGGYVATALAELHPSLVSGLVLFHSSPGADTPEKKEARKREIAIVEAGKKEMLADVNPGKGFAPENLKRCWETIDELGEQALMMEDQAIVGVLKGMMERRDRSDFFASLDKQRLMIFGRGDSYIPVETAEAMIEKFPSVEVEWLEKSGHMGFVEEPERSMEILSNFAEK